MTINKNCRFDHKVICGLVPAGSSVLDLGCGSGELLSKLINYKDVQGLGIEKEFDQVAETIARGVPVIHADLDEGLAGLPDRFFDYVILEKTLQAVKRPLFVLEEMLRVGSAGIVSFPNFGHRQVVFSLLSTGKMPVTSNLPYQWYDTPNIHLFTAKDFLEWADANNVRIEKGFSWTGREIVPFKEEESAFAQEILFVVSKINVTPHTAPMMKM
ncbi:methionine biosynthesis protein MetW [Pelotomaculum propionicicum]|uniref:methionine biosynthesis protein MetW n=1 Tax=Pelotomaculum propionicicum TaxID=258475 RepID=UPI003B7807B2